jgi:hypothetical protein
MNIHLSTGIPKATILHGLPNQFARSLMLAIPVACLVVGSAGAQQPTQAQRNAIKSACRSDFMAQCSSVTPGGQAALTCLQQHNSSLSSACQQAIAALGGAGKSAPAATAPAATSPATATAPAAPSFTPRQELAIVRQSCGPDFRAFCRSVQLGGGRAIACLRNNLARLSPTCQKILTAGR